MQAPNAYPADFSRDLYPQGLVPLEIGELARPLQMHAGLGGVLGRDEQPAELKAGEASRRDATVSRAAYGPPPGDQLLIVRALDVGRPVALADGLVEMHASEAPDMEEGMFTHAVVVPAAIRRIGVVTIGQIRAVEVRARVIGAERHAEVPRQLLELFQKDRVTRSVDRDADRQTESWSRASAVGPSGDGSLLPSSSRPSAAPQAAAKSVSAVNMKENPSRVIGIPFSLALSIAAGRSNRPAAVFA